MLESQLILYQGIYSENTAGAADGSFLILEGERKVKDVSGLIVVNLSEFGVPFFEFVLTFEILFKLQAVKVIVFIEHVRDFIKFDDTKSLM